MAPARHVDSGFMLGFKALLYALSLFLYLLPLTSGVGICAALLAAPLAMLAAALADTRRLRLPAAFTATLLVLTGGFLLGKGVLSSLWLPAELGLPWSFAMADVLTFGLIAFAIVFLLQFLSRQARVFSLVEVLFVAGSVVTTFADHRQRRLNRPRFFSDWVWSLGLDPSVVLIAVGVLATLAAVFLFLRGQRLLKVMTTLIILLLLGGIFFALKQKRIESQEPMDALGLSGKAKESSGRGEGSGQGGSGADNPFKDDYSGSSTPNPVAIAILRDDYHPESEVMYFRQVTLSSYNGHHLVNGTAQGWDTDVITEFPRSKPLQVEGGALLADLLVVPSTMYLLVDHPQPLALPQAVWLAPAPNPNPQQFVAAYEVRSHVLAVVPQRLLGRRSVPENWSPQTRAHYLALPDDPRYGALADIIVREVDPRFSGDDLAKAFAIRRYLEREGFYTMKSTHSSRSDPTASFLFGSLRGYCVHFAHAAVYLLRSQGIAARVALGYAVQTVKRSGGSSILIMSDRAHAWPEIHLEGIGWLTFDIYPERTDMPAPSPVDYDLEKLLGELARNDKTAGINPEGKPLRIPWRPVALGVGLFLAGVLLFAYAIKLSRQLAPRFSSDRTFPRREFLAILDRLADLGQARRIGETREAHARRLQQMSPHLLELTRAHLALVLGSRRRPDRQTFSGLARQVRLDLRVHVPRYRLLLAWLNPVGWLWTR